jgi:hypothetical protein
MATARLRLEGGRPVYALAPETRKSGRCRPDLVNKTLPKQGYCVVRRQGFEPRTR